MFRHDLFRKQLKRTAACNIIIAQRGPAMRLRHLLAAIVTVMFLCADRLLKQEHSLSKCEMQ